MKPLSERLEEEAASFKIIDWSEHGNIADDRHSDETKALLREAAALAKSVESATVISIESPCLRDCLADAGFTPTHQGQRVALVPLPQPEES